MASCAQLRLMTDLKAIKSEPPEGCSASPVSDENLFVWSATIFGPDETPWEGGVFGLRLIFGDNYPDRPPRVRFTSEVFHPNVYSDGTLCMDIIQDAWSPCHNVSTILTSIQVFVFPHLFQFCIISSNMFFFFFLIYGRGNSIFCNSCYFGLHFVFFYLFHSARFPFW
ncbi:ubiquitin-conjugating enzyme E2 [Rhynchospora pubera]|uniref:Ubiquitin-conjugating enzyme E2 n=1 Tax=Rhynchospora pubera TaxID=906938 RepID=A0AAV8DXN7_9POAL|nr:ubiquitin-conjugating enzyme E2 [Rhynchospora pubera]